MTTEQNPTIEMKVGRSATQFQHTLVTLALMSVCPLFALAQDGHSHTETQQHQEQTPEQQSQQSALLKIVRESTARFQDVKAAEYEGDRLEFGCVSGPDSGAMGLHYVNDTLVGNGIVDATRPQIVLYEAQSNGSLKLTGADYLVLAEASGHAATTYGADLPLLRVPKSLRSPGLLHAACLGVEGESERRIRKLAPRCLVPVIRRPNHPLVNYELQPL